MMTREQAIEFGKASAEMALDQVGEWGSIQNSIDNYRQNVRTTLQDERADQYEQEAFESFDRIIAKSK
jgi:hypothetical protein